MGRYKSRKQMIKYQYCDKWMGTVWKECEREELLIEKGYNQKG